MRLGVRALPAAFVRDDRVLEDVRAGTLRAGRGQRRAGAALAHREVGSGEPADAAQEGEGDRDAARGLQHFVLWEPTIGDREAALAIVHVDERLLRMVTDGLFLPRSVGFRQRDGTPDDAEVLLGV